MTKSAHGLVVREFKINLHRRERSCYPNRFEFCFSSRGNLTSMLEVLGIYLNAIDRLLLLSDKVV